MNMMPRFFKHFLIVACAAVSLPLLAQGEPVPEGARERCAGPMATAAHQHEGMKGEGRFPGEESFMSDRRPMDGMFMPGMPPLPPFFHDLTLTEAQQDKIFSIMHTSALPLHEQGKLAKKSADAIRELVESGSYDEAKLKSLADSHARATAELLTLQARNIHQMLALLTPEQRKQVDAMKTKFEDRHALRAQIEAIKARYDAPTGAGDK